MQLTALREDGGEEKARFWYSCPICRETRYWQSRCVSEYCGGNAARFELAKIRHGRRIHYLGRATSLRRSHSHDMVEILSELFRRVKKPSKALREWAAHIEHGYCLDAPTFIPAGGCFDEVLPEDFGLTEEESHLPAQIIVSRDGD